jgi:hypothetical protein
MLLFLRQDPDVRVVAAFLDNRFATEADVLQAATQARVRPESLAAIARHPRWSLRRSVRDALLRNPSLPAASAEALLDQAEDRELEHLQEDLGAPPAIRAIAQRVLARRSREV